MLDAAFALLAVAAIAGVLGFTNLASDDAFAAKVMFAFFLAGFGLLLALAFTDVTLFM